MILEATVESACPTPRSWQAGLLRQPAHRQTIVAVCCAADENATSSRDQTGDGRFCRGVRLSLCSAHSLASQDGLGDHACVGAHGRELPCAWLDRASPRGRIVPMRAYAGTRGGRFPTVPADDRWRVRNSHDAPVFACAWAGCRYQAIIFIAVHAIDVWDHRGPGRTSILG